MKVKLCLFASIRELVGTSREELDLPSDVSTFGALRAHLAARGGPWSEAMAKQLRMACNKTMCDEATPLAEGDEAAFFPPVTGG